MLGVVPVATADRAILGRFLRRGTRAQCYRESTARRKPQLCACAVCALQARTACLTAATGIRPHRASWRIQR